MTCPWGQESCDCLAEYATPSGNLLSVFDEVAEMTEGQWRAWAEWRASNPNADFDAVRAKRREIFP